MFYQGEAYSLEGRDEENCGQALYYETQGKEYPVFDKNNLEKPAALTLFDGERGDEIKLYHSSFYPQPDPTSEAVMICDDPDLLSNWNLGCKQTCYAGDYPVIYQGKVIPVEPFVYKVVGEYDKKYAVLEKEEADFYITFLESGFLLFYYNDEEYKTVDFNDENPNYTAYYTEPDGIELVSGPDGVPVCRYRPARKDPAEKDRE